MSNNQQQKENNMNMTLEHFLQGAAIYLVISIIAVAWFVKICDGEKKRKAKSKS